MSNLLPSTRDPWCGRHCCCCCCCRQFYNKSYSRINHHPVLAGDVCMNPQTRCHHLAMRISPSRQTELQNCRYGAVCKLRHMSVTQHLYNWREHKYASHMNKMYKYTKNWVHAEMNPQDPICSWTGHGIAKLHLRVECSKELWVFQ